MYRAREQKDILREMQDWSNTSASKIEGTFEYDMLAANSIEFAKVEVELEEAYRQSFGTTATGEYLTMRAAEAGIVRKEAVKAHGILTVARAASLPRRAAYVLLLWQIRRSWPQVKSRWRL